MQTSRLNTFCTVYSSLSIHSTLYIQYRESVQYSTIYNTLCVCITASAAWTAAAAVYAVPYVLCCNVSCCVQ